MNMTKDGETAMVYFGVPDMESAIERIKQNGGKILLPRGIWVHSSF
jgi:predicted enzyme related to lactoylglutathione lyase